jgi:hypothetical protein
MQSDSDLDVLRDEPRYHVMVARLMEQEAQLVP